MDYSSCIYRVAKKNEYPLNSSILALATKRPLPNSVKTCLHMSLKVPKMSFVYILYFQNAGKSNVMCWFEIYIEGRWTLSVVTQPTSKYIHIIPKLQTIHKSHFMIFLTIYVGMFLRNLVVVALLHAPMLKN